VGASSVAGAAGTEPGSTGCEPSPGRSAIKVAGVSSDGAAGSPGKLADAGESVEVTVASAVLAGEGESLAGEGAAPSADDSAPAALADATVASSSRA
jgi:hypothetical protein